MDKRRVSFFLMFIMVVLWGLDYSVAKNALDFFQPMTLLFYKFLGGLFAVFVLKMIMDRKFTIRKRDIVFFVSTSITGEILYYFCDYTAMSYIPVALITIILSFVPILAIMIERIFYRRKFSRTLMMGLIACVIGVALVIGADFRILLQGRAIGYLLAFGSVISWNAYNFITAKVADHYTALTMSFNQILCTVLLLLPNAIATTPPIETFTPGIVAGVLYLGLGSTGFGYVIMIRGIRDLGPTISAVFSNFLPVTSTFFGWLILGQHISFLQIIGGIVVIAASCYVIIEKEKFDHQTKLRDIS